MQPFIATLRHHADLQSEVPSLAGPDGEVLGRGALVARIDHVVSRLAAHGAIDGEPVLALLPDGPGTALLALACASRFAYAPVNPRTPGHELAALVARLGPRLALVAGNGPTPAALADIPTLAVDPTSLFETLGEAEGGAADDAGDCGTRTTPDLDDIAFLLPTSGTTGTPRFAAISQTNVAASIVNITRAFELTEGDHRLNVMPLFHVQGIVGGLVSPLCAGGRVTQTAGFQAGETLDLIERERVTWYSGVQAMQRELLIELERRGDYSHHLRFVRTGSSTLDEGLRERLSERLGVPVVSSYGMTEATSQITAQPFEGCKPGSCGKIVGPAVRLVGLDGEDVPAGEDGEVWIAGDNVVRRYHGDESPESFSGEWFRTGDLGHLDADGFLFLVGRSKHQISRGGEMIEPTEVEAVLNAHPRVLEAAVLGVEDERLGEELAALVVSDGPPSEVSELKAFVSERLVLHKVPRQIRFVEALPHNATGKLVRCELGALFAGLAPEPVAIDEPHDLGPRVPALQAIWKRLLKVDEVDLDTDFFDLGGGSLIFEEMLALVAEELRVTLDTLDLTGAITLRSLDAALESGDPGPFVIVRAALADEGAHTAQGAGAEGASRAAEAPALWLFPPVGGHLTTMGRLAQRLDWPGPILALRGPGEGPGEAPGESVEEVAAWYLALLDADGRHTPPSLLGVSFGGLVAFELARQLREAGRPVGALGVLDTVCTTYAHRAGSRRFIQQVTRILCESDLADEVSDEAERSLWERLEAICLQLTGLEKPDDPKAAAWDAMRKLGFEPRLRLEDPVRWRRRLRKVRLTFSALDHYELRNLDTPMVYFRAGKGFAGSDPAMGWSAHAAAGLEVAMIEGNHFTIWDDEHLDATARTVSQALGGMRGKLAGSAPPG